MNHRQNKIVKVNPLRVYCILALLVVFCFFSPVFTYATSTDPALDANPNPTVDGGVTSGGIDRWDTNHNGVLSSKEKKRRDAIIQREEGSTVNEDTKDAFGFNASSPDSVVGSSDGNKMKETSDTATTSYAATIVKSTFTILGTIILLTGVLYVALYVFDYASNQELMVIETLSMHKIQPDFDKPLQTVLVAAVFMCFGIFLASGRCQHLLTELYSFIFLKFGLS